MELRLRAREAAAGYHRHRQTTCEPAFVRVHGYRGLHALAFDRHRHRHGMMVLAVAVDRDQVAALVLELRTPALVALAWGDFRSCHTRHALVELDISMALGAHSWHHGGVLHNRIDLVVVQLHGGDLVVVLEEVHLWQDTRRPCQRFLKDGLFCLGDLSRHGLSRHGLSRHGLSADRNRLVHLVAVEAC